MNNMLSIPIFLDNIIRSNSMFYFYFSNGG